MRDLHTGGKGTKEPFGTLIKVGGPPNFGISILNLSPKLIIDMSLRL